MVVSINMTDEEIKLAKAYAKLIGLPLNKVIKRTFFEKIEDIINREVACICDFFLLALVNSSWYDIIMVLMV